VLKTRALVADGSSDPPAKRSTARDRALRFNRAVIALCVLMLLLTSLLPV
jgi:hypothetical protein